jgi:molybdopterin synthase catalytic subunit
VTSEEHAGTRADGAPAAIAVRVRLFAVQRELAGARELRLELPAGAVVEDAWAALVRRVPALAPGRASVRFAVNGDYAEPATDLHDGDELACIPPVSGGAREIDTDAPNDGEIATDAPNAGWIAGGAGGGDPGRRRIVEIRETPFGPEILVELADRLATPYDGAVVGFLGRTRLTPGTPAPGQEEEAQRHAGRAVESLEYEAHESMALRMLDRIAEEIRVRFDVDRVAIVHRTGAVPLGDVSIAVVAVSPHRDAAFLAARYAIDETKGRVPIWKAERFEDGHVWIGEPARTAPPGPAPAASGTSKVARTGGPAPAASATSTPASGGGRGKARPG